MEVEEPWGVKWGVGERVMGLERERESHMQDERGK